jgi:hypothetical protein
VDILVDGSGVQRFRSDKYLQFMFSGSLFPDQLGKLVPIAFMKKNDALEPNFLASVKYGHRVK